MEWSGMFFEGWQGIVRTLVVGTLAYVTVVVFLRIAGARTLAKLNAFDLVVTVALGSTLAAILLNQDVPLIQGATAVGLLILIQYLVTAASVRSEAFARLVRSDPQVLLRNGEFCREAMRRERITEGEILSAVRANGGTEAKYATLVVLESDGTVSVITGDEVSASDADGLV